MDLEMIRKGEARLRLRLYRLYYAETGMQTHSLRRVDKAIGMMRQGNIDAFYRECIKAVGKTA